jgi:hypothetical protein
MIYEIGHSQRLCEIYPAQKRIVIDKSFFKIPYYNIRVFILLHEIAHLYTANEMEADWLAFKTYYQRGYPIRDSIIALTRYITDKRNAYQRAKKLLDRLYEL